MVRKFPEARGIPKLWKNPEIWEFPRKFPGNFLYLGNFLGDFPGNSYISEISWEIYREIPVPQEILKIREFPRSENFPPVSQEMENFREFPTQGILLNIADLG